jgi:hypothetical protein
MNQTEETMQINNTINLLSKKTEYSRYIIFEPIHGVHPTRFSEAEDALQDRKDRRIKSFPITRPWQMVAPL